MLRPNRGRDSSFLRTRLFQTLVVFCAYLAASFLLFGLPVAAHPGRSYVGTGGQDPKLFIWLLAWWPHALIHAENPLLTRAIWAPTGYNLAWTTSLPGPSLIMAPITLAFGPVVSLNLLAVLSAPLAGLTAYLMCRELTNAPWPSALGGAIFGFSSYEIGQLHGHVNLYLVFAIPLCVYLTLAHVSGRLGPGAFVGLLALALVLQFSTSTEVFATLTLVAGISLVLALAMLEESERRKLRAAIPLIGLAYALAVVVVSPYLYYVFESGFRSRGGVGRGSDLLNLVLPNENLLVGGNLFPNLVARFPGHQAEQGAYLGIPLIAIAAHFFVTSWKARSTKLLLACGIACVLLTLGASLTVGGRSFGWLPWRIIRELPLLHSVQAIRFSVFVSLVISVVVAIWVRSASSGHLWRRTAVVALAAVLLLPNLPAGGWHSSFRMPAFFGTGLYRGYLGAGENVLILTSAGEAMLWQAETGVSFRIAEGYTGAFPPKDFLGRGQLRRLVSGRLSIGDLPWVDDFLRSHRVQAVVLAVEDAGAADTGVSVLTTLWGEPREIGGVLLFRSPPTVDSTQ